MSGEAYESTEEERRLLDRIDAELRASLEVSPSPEFLPRVRRRVAEPVPGSWRGAGWLAAAAATGGLVVGSAFLGQDSAPVPRPAAQAADLEGPEPSVLPVAGAPKSPGGSRGRSRRSPPPLVRAEVLVPPEQDALLRRYVQALSGRPFFSPTYAMAAVDPDLGEIEIDPAALRADGRELRGIDVASIEVKPLTMDPMNEE